LKINNNRTTRKEVCWILSNITAGTKEQAQAVIGNLDYFNILIKTANFDVPEVKLNSEILF